MTAIYIVLAIALIIQTGMGLAIYRLKRKMKDAIYMRRIGDRLFLEDGDGNIISEKIIIEKAI